MTTTDSLFAAHVGLGVMTFALVVSQHIGGIILKKKIESKIGNPNLMTFRFFHKVLIIKSVKWIFSNVSS